MLRPLRMTAAMLAVGFAFFGAAGVGGNFKHRLFQWRCVVLQAGLHRRLLGTSCDATSASRPMAR